MWKIKQIKKSVYVDIMVSYYLKNQLCIPPFSGFTSIINLLLFFVEFPDRKKQQTKRVFYPENSSFAVETFCVQPKVLIKILKV